MRSQVTLWNSFTIIIFKSLAWDSLGREYDHLLKSNYSVPFFSSKISFSGLLNLVTFWRIVMMEMILSCLWSEWGFPFRLCVKILFPLYCCWFLVDSSLSLFRLPFFVYLLKFSSRMDVGFYQMGFLFSYFNTNVAWSLLIN